MRDKVSKNRQARGETIGTVKLTEEEIKEIRRRYATHRRNSSGPNSQASMAREFGVTQAAIPYVILHGWKHV
jgi:low affinity Fe/Cu permease